MAIEKEITNDIGQYTKYHKIKSVEADFETMQLHFTIASYTTPEYRELEKKQKESIVQEIKSIKSDEDISPEEKQLRLQILECKNIKNREAIIQKYTLPIKESSLIKDLYQRIMNEIEVFKNSKKV